MTQKHTPGPWRVAAPPDKVCTAYPQSEMNYTTNGWAKTIVVCKHASWMKDGEEFANAEFIVRACNSHYELLEALKDARYALYGNGPANPKIDAAIAKAEGGGA